MSISILNFFAKNPWLMAVLGGAVVLLYVVVLVFGILTIVGEWKMFKKAGRPGWHSLIPFLREYDLYGMSWETKKYWVYLGIMVLSQIVEMICNNLGDGAVYLVLSVVGMILNLGCIYIEVKMSLKLAKVFGKGKAFGVGFYFLPGVFSLILGMGEAQYDESAKDQ